MSPTKKNQRLRTFESFGNLLFFNFRFGVSVIYIAFMKTILKKSWIALLVHGGLNVFAALFILLLYSSAVLLGFFTLLSGMILFICFFYGSKRYLAVFFIAMISIMAGCWLILFSPQGLDQIKWLLCIYAALLGFVTILLAYKTWKHDRITRFKLDEFERWY